MQEPFLCLSDLLDQDLSSYEYFHSLPLEVQKKMMSIHLRICNR